jgi:hypothetical protein
MSVSEISNNFNIPKKLIYQLRNSNEIRWIKNTVNFHIDDVRGYIKKY